MRTLRAHAFAVVAVCVLGLLAGCGGHYLFAEREPWRHQAEVDCINSGAVKEGAGKVRIGPIEGPGVCGIDVPLKVSSLGGDNEPLGYDEPRPPGTIPDGGGYPPAWPIMPPRPAAAAVTQNELPPPGTARISRPLAPAPSFTYGPRSVPVTTPPGPVAVSPAATLACPLVSALDQWIDEAVQPAALKWLGQPVVEIKQISAYSCRGMNGDPNATISEHAFGNALDIAAFTFADGRKVDVEHGWHGAPEEQAFLHDVQGRACDQFTTVLAPGYNIYHYNHIHVDLMRRQSGRRACQPQPVSGDEVAARLGARISARRGEPSSTGSINRSPIPAPRARPIAITEHKDRKLPVAVPGADGED